MDAPCLALILKMSWFWTPPPPTLMDGYLTAKFCKLMRVQHTCKPDKSSYPSIQRRRREELSDYQNQEGKSKTLSNLNLLIKKTNILFPWFTGSLSGEVIHKLLGLLGCCAVLLSHHMKNAHLSTTHFTSRPMPSDNMVFALWEVFFKTKYYYFCSQLFFIYFLIILMCRY